MEKERGAINGQGQGEDGGGRGVGEGEEKDTIALCAVRKVYFSAQPNNLKLILNFEKYYPIEHIFVPACSSAPKIHFFQVLVIFKL